MFYATRSQWVIFTFYKKSSEIAGHYKILWNGLKLEQQLALKYIFDIQKPSNEFLLFSISSP